VSLERYSCSPLYVCVRLVEPPRFPLESRAPARGTPPRRAEPAGAGRRGRGFTPACTPGFVVRPPSPARGRGRLSPSGSRERPLEGERDGGPRHVGRLLTSWKGGGRGWRPGSSPRRRRPVPGRWEFEGARAEIAAAGAASPPR